MSKQPKEGKAYIGDEIVEGNEVIALFMGAEWCEDDYGEWGYKGNFPGPFQYRAKNNLKYHSSWDWLMPVVEKISKIPLLNVDGTSCADPVDTCYPITFNMPTEVGEVMFRFKGFSLHIADNLIDAAWKAVVEVCEYETNNTQTKKQ